MNKEIIELFDQFIDKRNQLLELSSIVKEQLDMIKGKKFINHTTIEQGTYQITNIKWNPYKDFSGGQIQCKLLKSDGSVSRFGGAYIPTSYFINMVKQRLFEII